mmetsp:Transcript_55116/g.123207  ORF Transcript_55116/g.123207 Transcript_55116/m.123207 type:complete len:268 (-) Transcript_55116:38-841(-)
MQVLQGRNHAASVEGRGITSGLVCEENVLVSAEEPIEIASESGFQEKVNELVVLHGLVEPHDELAVKHVQEVPLPAQGLARAAAPRVALRHPLQSVTLLARFVLHQKDGAESALAQSANLFDRVQTAAAFQLLAAAASLQLLPFTHVGVHIGQHGGVADGQAGEDFTNQLAIKRETREAVGPCVHAHLRDALARDLRSQQRPLPEGVASRQLRNASVFLPIVLAQDSGALEDYIPHGLLTNFALEKDALAWIKANHIQRECCQLHAL